MHLVVIGGTAAGMSCAARARRLDENADITVLEKTDHVSSASCGLPYHLSGTIASRSALEVIQKVRDGEPLGGKSSAESDFATDETEDFLD